MKNKTKKVALVFSLLSFVLITVGTTLAFFKYREEGNTTNTITTGGITFHYKELDGIGHGISITDAMPVTDNNAAKSMDKAFNFEITSKTAEQIEIPYTVTARLANNADQVMGNIVDVYLTEVNGTSETPTELFASNLPKYNELEQYSGVTGYIEKVIYEGVVPANTANYRKNFRLRIWIDQYANFSEQCSINPTTNNTATKCVTAGGNWGYQYNDKTFSITVNVNSLGNKETPVDPNAPRRLYLAVSEPAEAILNTIPDVDPNDNTNPANHCDPTTDSTCRVCDPSTDSMCSSFENRKRDKCTDYTNGICKTTDDDDNNDGVKDTIYYYRGGNVNNYVKFGDDEHLWRIIRTNSDETVRIMRTWLIPTTSNGDIYRIGYIFTQTNMDDIIYFSTSPARLSLDRWYSTDIAATNLDRYVATGKYFCEEFKYASNASYVPSMYTNTAKTPNSNPPYSKNYNCNRLLYDDAGLITYDEYEKATSGFFNDLGQLSSYRGWTMSPAGLDNSFFPYNYTWSISNNNITASAQTESHQLYPVINLKSDVMVTGTGSQDDPFVVQITPVEADPQPSGPTLTDMILEDNPTRKTNPDLTHVASYSNENGLYEATSTSGYGGGNGTTYVFRGDVNNNIVKFANKIWRIVRVNEDGTVRLVLDSSIDSNNYSFNNIYDYNNPKNTDFGYMYYSYADNITSTLNNWYSTNITGTNASKVAKGNYFCDAVMTVPALQYTGSSTSSTVDTYTPSFDCLADTYGMRYVHSTIGLLTFDEAKYAGFNFGEADTDNYLYKGIESNNNYNYWTMSPAGAKQETGGGKMPAVWYLEGNQINQSYIVINGVKQDRRIRPVINLKANTTATRKTDSVGGYNYYEVN